MHILLVYSDYDIDTEDEEFHEEDLNDDREDDVDKHDDNDKTDENDDTVTAVDKSSDPQSRRTRSRFIRGGVRRFIRRVRVRRPTRRRPVRHPRRRLRIRRIRIRRPRGLSVEMAHDAPHLQLS